MTSDDLPAVSYADPDSQSAVERYRGRYREFQNSPETLGWRSGTQEVRFSAFVAGFELGHPSSVLDIGCGFGDLLSFLRRGGWTGNYLGVDIVPEFIASAKGRFVADAGAEFRCLDFMEHANAFACDAVLASGLLNHRRSSGHEEFVQRFIEAIAKSSRRYAAIDFLSATADRRREDLYYFDPGWVLQCGCRSSKRVQLDHSYMPFEFMLKLWFPDSLQSGLPLFA